MYTFNKYSTISIPLLLIIFLLGCTEEQDPITSEEISIVVNSMNQSDINEQGIIEKDENISNGSGNPWGEFIKEAESQCDGNPRQFEIVYATIQIIDQNGINSFEDVINGRASVKFLSTQGSDTDAIRVEIGTHTNPTGTAAVELMNLADQSDLGILKERLLGGDFHVGFSGETNLTKDDEFSFDVMIKFAVRAHCD